MSKVNYKTLTLTLGLIAFSFLFVWYVFAQWTEPTAVPPGDNVPAPLNVGGVTQYKSGALGVGGLFATDSATYLATLGGNVGIGTTNPTNKLTFFSAASEDVIRFNGPFDAYATLGHNFGGGLARVSLTSQDDVFGLSSFVAVDPYEYARLVQCDPSGSMSWEVSSNETVAWLSTTGLCGGGSPMFRIYSGADGGNRRVSIGPFRAPSDKSFYVWGGDVAFERNDAPLTVSLLSNGWGTTLELEGQGGGDSWLIEAKNSGDLRFFDVQSGNAPFKIMSGGIDRLMTLAVDHIQLFGSAGSVGSKTLTIGEGIAPGAGTIANAVTMWVADRGGVVGKAALHIQTEDDTRHVFGDRVGIGTTSPNELLEIAGSGRAFFGNGGGGARTGLLIDGNEGGAYARLESFDYGAFTGIDLVINTVGGGNVGIGTTSPKSKLHVVGLPEYTGNAAAIAGGLTAGAFYRTGDLLKVVH
ncbi:hypothetical protein LCGC14_0214160 [marine sediment metagenome]|uniref:Uncharacterized protein n=1 Tax=marine sediment metagenome TaxID=412755 RepID=A0A0F9XID5_9ZZZZ